MPLVSIIVPAYNRERVIAATLDSIAAQTMTDWEAVIVDDGSTDATLAVAESYAAADARFMVLTQANSGSSVARNLGFRHTSGRYVTFMDSDDVWLPDALAVLLEAASQPDVIGALGLGEYIAADGTPVALGEFAETGRRRLAPIRGRLKQIGLDEPTSFACLLGHMSAYPIGLWLVTRETYLKAGPFDEQFRRGQDWDMALRLSRYGNTAFVNRVILQYRLHGGNQGGDEAARGALGLAGESSEATRLSWIVRCKTFYSPENTPEHRVILRRAWRAWQVAVAEEIPGEMWAAARRRDWYQLLRQPLRLGPAAVRWLRGRPLPRYESEPLHWDQGTD